jgi:tRNA-splicing ligase RtcB (3'-phosphate/5'-hydroxy nucleic acid ligase)
MTTVYSDQRIPIKSWCHDIDNGAMTQAKNLAELPCVFRHVALMPDCHEGFGMPIGGVIACMDAIIPNAVGVDIGCGMTAVQTDCRSEALTVDTIRKILNGFRGAIPLGFDHHNKDQSWNGFARAPHAPVVLEELTSARRQLGTLGGGNHFIELQKDTNGSLWLMIHSGSRNFGYKIAAYYHKKALALCDKRHIALPDSNLAYLPLDSREAREYFEAMNYALAFAFANRALMRERCKDILLAETKCSFGREFDVHHNYAVPEKHFGREVIVHRKGAIRAGVGDNGIIPGSMGTVSYIVRGLGNPESFMSCSHGAGRVMGRNETNRRLSLEEARTAMKGIVFDGWSGGKRKGKIDLSEAPQAYKKIDVVMEAQKDLVAIEIKLLPIGVVKG